MSRFSNKEEIRAALDTLVTTHVQSTAQLEQAISGLSFVLDIERTSARPSSRSIPDNGAPRADRDTLSIVWRGKSCFLGNTLLFRLFERLAKSPNRYVSHADLLDDVWGADRHASTIRGVAKRLRDRLREQGMGTVADAIDGSVTGYYGLKPV